MSNYKLFNDNNITYNLLELELLQLLALDLPLNAFPLNEMTS